jgi:hypothetical protein
MRKINRAHILLLLHICIINANKQAPFPICFSISENKIVSEIPQKTRDFAYIVPGQLNTYIYTEESDYYQDYQRSFFAFTKKKGGWDCLRHYEILASGCIPYFVDIDKCPKKTMHLFPKKLIKEAMQLEGISYGKIDHKKFNYKQYYEILEQLLEHTRKYLTTRNIAQYMLDTINYTGNGHILFLPVQEYPDYMTICLLIGLKQLYPETIVDFPKIDYIYTNYTGNTIALYGKGFTYTKVIEDFPVDRTNIVERIKNKEFDLIIYSHVHLGRPLYDIVSQYYPAEKIVYVCGEDAHTCPFTHLQNFFLREYDAYKP